MRGFIVIISWICVVYFEQVHLPHYNSHSPLSNKIWWVSYSYEYVCVYIYFDLLHTSVSFPFLLPLPT
jgi:hypothetical protein